MPSHRLNDGIEDWDRDALHFLFRVVLMNPLQNTLQFAELSAGLRQFQLMAPLSRRATSPRYTKTRFKTRISVSLVNQTKGSLPEFKPCLSDIEGGSG